MKGISLTPIKIDERNITPMKTKSKKTQKKLFIAANNIADSMDDQALQLERAYDSLMDTVNRLKHQKATRKSPSKSKPETRQPAMMPDPDLNVRGLVKQELMKILQEVA